MDPVSHYSEDVGKRIRSSKRLFVWQFSGHLVRLAVSVLSGKRVVSVDEEVVCNVSTMREDFSFEFVLEDRRLRIQARGEEGFDLFVDSIPFLNLTPSGADLL